MAAVTAAGRGPFSAWWRAADATSDSNGDGDSDGDGDGGGDGGGGSGSGDGDSDGAGAGVVTGPPLTVTATIPRHTASPSLPTWLVAVLCCLGFFTLGAGVLALHCRRLRRKQSVLVGNTRELDGGGLVEMEEN